MGPCHRRLGHEAIRASISVNVVGRYGSANSTLSEAVEVALTGTSYHREENTAKEMAHSPRRRPVVVLGALLLPQVGGNLVGAPGHGPGGYRD